MPLYLLQTGEPTYWPTNQHRIPDLLDFFVARGVASNYVRLFELSSDHSPIIATIGDQIFPGVVPPTLVTHNTEWNVFRTYIADNINLYLRIKQCSELDDATVFYYPPPGSCLALHTPPSDASGAGK
jgi:hypothetical protein